jgi:hypothetical protein
MTRDELTGYLDMVLSRVADGPPAGPRPAGAFVGSLPSRTISGLRIVAPDGTRLYIAVLETDAFETPPR